MSNRNLLLASAGAGEDTDPNFNQTVLLLHGDGTNGAQNNTFLDSSSNNFTITRNGNTTQGTFSPYGDLWSNYFDGTGDCLIVPSNAGFQFGTGDFTIEGWFFKTASVSCRYFTFSDDFLNLDSSAFNTLSTYRVGNLSYNTSIPLSTWHHVAITRQSGTARLFVDGVNVSSGTSSEDYSATRAFHLGVNNNADNDYFPGYISNLRIVKGTALYTSAFTPPTAPLTAVSGTSLLTCQSNRFKDNSSNNFAITPNGDVKVTTFSPYAPSAAYDPAVNGGSGYFDGNGDYLTVADNAAFEIDGDFTIEAWFYINTLPSAGNYANIINKGASGIYQPYYIFVQNGSLLFYSSSNGTSWNVASASSFGTVTAGQWYHVAVSRSGTALRMFFNGALVNTITNGDALYNNNRAVALGARSDGTEDDLVGYISDARIVKGTALYTSTFTPPTAPLTAVSGTSLLCNFTNAGIIDNTGKNVLETVGNAQIDTAVKKYGTGSMEFDGVGYLLAPTNPDFTFGTGDFTVEAWLYQATADSGFVVSVNFNAVTAWYLGVGVLNSNLLSFGKNTQVPFAVSSNALSTGAWNHIAASRSNGTIRLFINGNLEATVSDAQDYSAVAGIRVATNQPINADWGLIGYIDDLRITKGIARYTANFTPPAKAFPNL